MDYTKQALTLAQQIETLKQRGLIIDDEAEATAILDRTSYFRLADYWRPMEVNRHNHIFKADTHFNDIVTIYRFDTELKQIIFNAILQIEITTRSKMIRYFSAMHDPFWFADQSLSEDAECFQSNIAHVRREIKRSQEDFITEHFAKYDTPDFPPAWKTLEVLTLGTVSKLYTNFSDNTAKDLMAKDFGLPQHLILGSWLASLTVLRNKCAHHARVWNRRFPVMPELPRKTTLPWITNRNVHPFKLYPQLCCIAYWLRAINSQSTFTDDIRALLSRYPTVSTAAMGFPKEWKDEPLWQLHATADSRTSHSFMRLFRRMANVFRMSFLK
ncbi:MAG: Abi family protein [Prevotella sp.]|nr:Abi family protein [Prevotella sp.]